MQLKMVILNPWFSYLCTPHVGGTGMSHLRVILNPDSPASAPHTVALEHGTHSFIWLVFVLFWDRISYNPDCFRGAEPNPFTVWSSWWLGLSRELQHLDWERILILCPQEREGGYVNKPWPGASRWTGAGHQFSSPRSQLCLETTVTENSNRTGGNHTGHRKFS